MTTRTRWTVLASLAALLLAAAPIEAQRSRRGQQDRERLEQRIRAQMGRVISERLQLTEEEGDALSEVVQGFDSQRRDLYREEQRLRRSVDDLLEDDTATEADASDLLNRMIALQREEAELFAEEQAALLEVLSPAQVLQLMELRREIGRRIRGIRGSRGNDDDGDRRRRRGGRG